MTLDRARLRRISALALPIVGGMASQNLLNLVDTAMVGSLGDVALAAVGHGSFASFMSIAFMMGLSSGVQAVAARRLGEGAPERAAEPLHAAAVIAAVYALVLSTALWFAVPALFPLMNDDPAVAAAGVPYLRARVLSILFVGLNFSFRGFWNGVHRPGLYMRTLLIMHACNIALNWVLIYGHLGAPALGAAGAGIASAIATGVGTCVYIFHGLRHGRPFGFFAERPHAGTVRTILRIGAPQGINQLLFSTGLTLLFVIIGTIGTSQVAAANVLINVMLVAILPGIALGLTAASLVGQALGRGDPADARAWGWDVGRVAVVALFALGLPMILVPDVILGLFIHDAQTLALARLPLRLFGAVAPVDALGLVLMHALLGAGDSRAVMLISVAAQWLLFLPAAWLVGPTLGLGLLAIWIAQLSYRSLLAGVFALRWRSEGWTTIRV